MELRRGSRDSSRYRDSVSISRRDDDDDDDEDRVANQQFHDEAKSFRNLERVQTRVVTE